MRHVFITDGSLFLQVSLMDSQPCLCCGTPLFDVGSSSQNHSGNIPEIKPVVFFLNLFSFSQYNSALVEHTKDTLR